MAADPRFLLLTAIFFFDFLFTRTLGDPGTRYLVIAKSIVHLASLLLLGSILIAFARRIPGRRLGAFHLEMLPPSITVLFTLLVLASVFSAIVGMERAHDTVYTIGDLYKFLLLPFGVFIVMNAILSREDLRKTVAVVVALYSMFLVTYVGLYCVGILSPNVRPALIYYYPLMLVLLFYARPALAQGCFRCLTAIYLLCMPLLVWYSQSLKLIAQIIIFVGLTTVFYHGIRKTLVVAICYILPLVLAGTAIAIWIAHQLEWILRFSPSTYLFSKFYFLQTKGFTLLMMELVLGDRVAQVAAVINYFLLNPKELLIGQGMGGTIFVLPLSELASLNKAGWDFYTHFIESGYAEVLLRTGIIGLMAYAGFLFLAFMRAWRNARGNLFCAIASTYFLYFMVFSSINEGFLGPFFFLIGMIFTGVLRESGSTHRQPSVTLHFGMPPALPNLAKPPQES